VLAGQNGTTTGFGAAAHTNGTQDEDEQAEPEEAVRYLVIAFTLLDSSYSCCTSISHAGGCSKIAQFNVGVETCLQSCHHAILYVAA